MLNLFVQEPSANLAITHDDYWITMLEEVCYGPHPMESSHLCVSQDLLLPEDLVQEGRLETLVSQKYNIILENGIYLNFLLQPYSCCLGVVYLRSRGLALFWSFASTTHSSRNSESGTVNAVNVDATMERLDRRSSNNSGSPRLTPSTTDSSHRTADSPAESMPPSPVVELLTSRSATTGTASLQSMFRTRYVIIIHLKLLTYRIHEVFSVVALHALKCTWSLAQKKMKVCSQ